MTYDGRVQNGVIILEGAPKLPEGVRVRVETVEPPPHPAETSSPHSLLDLAGAIDDLPADFSRNHDHYIHGTPKRQ